MKAMYYTTIIGWGFSDIRDNQGRGKCIQSIQPRRMDPGWLKLFELRLNCLLSRVPFNCRLAFLPFAGPRQAYHDGSVDVLKKWTGEKRKK